MTDRPILLDACCGVGGATEGFRRAGFHVVGVDIAPQPDYPGDEFHQGDAVEFINRYGGDFAFIAASPPCQAGCTLTAGTNRGRVYPQLIPDVREALLATGRPWSIENPPGRAPIRRDLMLCGDMFPSLSVIRHRNFELHGVRIPQPAHVPHRGRVSGMRHGKWYQGPYVAVYGDGGGKGTVAQWQEAMGIDWTGVRVSIAEAIPPAYTEYIGRQLIDQL
ncbi:MAG: DNA methylase [Pseudonocardiaceae bacterium]